MESGKVVNNVHEGAPNSDHEGVQSEEDDDVPDHKVFFNKDDDHNKITSVDGGVIPDPADRKKVIFLGPQNSGKKEVLAHLCGQDMELLKPPRYQGDTLEAQVEDLDICNYEPEHLGKILSLQKLKRVVIVCGSKNLEQVAQKGFFESLVSGSTTKATICQTFVQKLSSLALDIVKLTHKGFSFFPLFPFFPFFSLFFPFFSIF